MSFLAELVLRVFGKTPHFFKVVQVVSIIIAAVTGLPDFLNSIGLDLPESFDVIANKVISIAAIVAAFIAQLTVTTDTKKQEHIPD
jgi:hypothetical protein